jgi:hypothetical protein
MSWQFCCIADCCHYTQGLCHFWSLLFSLPINEMLSSSTDPHFLESTKNPREFLDSFWIQFIWEQIRFHVDFSIFPFGKFLPRWIIRVHQDLLLPWWIIFSPECVCVSMDEIYLNNGREISHVKSDDL